MRNSLKVGAPKRCNLINLTCLIKTSSPQSCLAKWLCMPLRPGRAPLLMLRPRKKKPEKAEGTGHANQGPTKLPKRNFFRAMCRKANAIVAEGAKPKETFERIRQELIDDRRNCLATRVMGSREKQIHEKALHTLLNDPSSTWPRKIGWWVIHRFPKELCKTYFPNCYTWFERKTKLHCMCKTWMRPGRTDSLPNSLMCSLRSPLISTPSFTIVKRPVWTQATRIAYR